MHVLPKNIHWRLVAATPNIKHPCPLGRLISYSSLPPSDLRLVYTAAAQPVGGGLRRGGGRSLCYMAKSRKAETQPSWYREGRWPEVTASAQGKKC